jgi:hypothetical protein
MQDVAEKAPERRTREEGGDEEAWIYIYIYGFGFFWGGKEMW